MPASVAATPPCSATPFQRQLDVRHSWQFKDDRCDRAFLGGECSAILLQDLKNSRISEDICCDTCSATRVVRQGGPRTRVQLWAVQLLILFSEHGSEGKVLTKETRFSLLRGESPGNCSGSKFYPDTRFSLVRISIRDNWLQTENP